MRTLGFLVLSALVSCVSSPPMGTPDLPALCRASDGRCAAFVLYLELYGLSPVECNVADRPPDVFPACNVWVAAWLDGTVLYMPAFGAPQLVGSANALEVRDAIRDAWESAHLVPLDDRVHFDGARSGGRLRATLWRDGNVCSLAAQENVPTGRQFEEAWNALLEVMARLEQLPKASVVPLSHELRWCSAAGSAVTGFLWLCPTCHATNGPGLHLCWSCGAERAGER